MSWGLNRSGAECMDSELDFSSIREDAIPVWEAAFNACNDEFKPIIKEMINWLSEGSSAFHPLLRGEGYKPSNKSIHDLTDAIKKHLSSDLSRIYKWLAIIRQVIILGNDMRSWNLELPPLSIKVPREKGRFNPDRFRSRVLAKNWKCALTYSISRDENLEQEYMIAQIILSAMLYGGITNQQLLIALVKSLSFPPMYYNEKRYINLKPTWRGQDNAETRRWFPDALTETLILRYSNYIYFDPQPQLTGSWIFKIVNRFLKKCAVSKENLPSGIMQLCNIASIQYELYFPSFLADYCSRRFINHSLRDSAWKRIVDPVDDSKDEQPLELSGWDTYQKLDEEQDDSYPFKSIAFIGIREAIRSEKIEIVLAQLDRHISTLDHEEHGTEYLFSKWISYLLKPHKGSRAIKTSTARNYVSIIGTRLYEVLPNENLIELSSDEFEEAYSLILENIDSENHKRKVAKTLYQFHRYIEEYHDITRIDYHSVLGAYAAPTPVDANILWVDEFDRTQEAIKNSDLIQMHPDLVEVVELIFMLGYRCGLRRMEALRLRLIDVSGTYKPDLLVRPFLGRTLKTSSSRRKMPLYALLSEEEWKKLCAWKEKRLKQELEVEFSEYLFAVKELNFRCAPEDLVFPIIHKAMRSVTGDQTLRYHHLRHSFASLTLLKLLAANYGAPLSLFSHLPKQCAEIEDAKTFTENLMILPGPTRKLLYSVARLLGHSGPDISLGHYIHTLDIMVKYLCDQYFPVTWSILVAASGKPKETAYRWLRNGFEAYLKGVRRQYGGAPGQTKSLSRAINPDLVIDIDIVDKIAIDRVNQVKQALLLYSKFELSADDLAQRFNTTSKDIQICIDAAKALQAIRTNGPRSGRRFLFQDYKDYFCHKQTTLCPKEPRRQSDKALAESLITRLSALSKREFNLYAKGLTIFKNNTWSTKYQLVLKTDEEVRDYLTFLDALNIPKSQIKLILLHGKRASETYIKNGLRYWESAIPTSRSYQWNKHTSTDGARMSEYGWLGINILNPETQESSMALRYALTMELVLGIYKQADIYNSELSL